MLFISYVPRSYSLSSTQPVMCINSVHFYSPGTPAKQKSECDGALIKNTSESVCLKPGGKNLEIISFETDDDDDNDKSERLFK